VISLSQPTEIELSPVRRRTGRARTPFFPWLRSRTASYTAARYPLFAARFSLQTLRQSSWRDDTSR